MAPRHSRGATAGLSTFSKRESVAQHDHAMCVYDSDRRLLTDLDHFVIGGQVASEVTTFVHAYDDPRAASRLLAHRVPHAHEAAEDEAPDLLVSDHRAAFEREGRIDHVHAASVVTALTEEARARGRAGTRIFVDASKRYIGTLREDEWFAFESWLGPHLEASTALVCAYDARQLEDPDVLARVLATHAYRFAAPTIRAI